MMEQDLVKKLKLFEHRWEIVWNFYLDVENEIEKRWREELDTILDDSQELNDDLRQQLAGIDMRYRNVHREGMLIQVCSLVEYALRLISRVYVPEYEAKMPGGRGSWLKHLDLLSDTVEMVLDEEDIPLFQDIWTLRNCVTHVGGKVEEDSNPEKIREIICRFQKLGEKSNEDMVGETEDGYILFGTGFVSEVVVRGENIFRAVFEAIC